MFEATAIRRDIFAVRRETDENSRSRGRSRLFLKKQSGGSAARAPGPRQITLTTDELDDPLKKAPPLPPFGRSSSSLREKPPSAAITLKSHRNLPTRSRLRPRTID